jgi:hypothetical protein
MVFKDKVSGTDIYCRRYTTYEEALEGHKATVNKFLTETL